MRSRLLGGYFILMWALLLGAAVRCARPIDACAPGQLCARADAVGLAGFASGVFARYYVDESYGGNGKPGFVRAGDIHGDGDVDLVAGGGRALYVYEEDAGVAGGWTRHGNLDGTGIIGANGAALYDVDGDSNLDVISAKYKQELGWWENPGGTLDDTPWVFHRLGAGFGGWFAHDVIRDDLDRDGTAEEFVFVLTQGYWSASSHIYWYRPGADPMADWEAHAVTHNHAGPNNSHAGIDLADLDADSDVDVVFADGWFESPGDPTGTWTWHEVATGSDDVYGVSNAQARDMDGDSDLDLVMSGGHHGQGVYWFENAGDPHQPGNWARHDISAVKGDVTSRCYYDGTADYLHHPEGLQVLDLDRDGDMDVVVAELFFGEDTGEPAWSDEQHNLYVYESSRGQLPSFTRHSIAPNSFASHQLQIADVNRDGWEDVVSEGCGYQIVSYYERLALQGQTYYVDPAGSDHTGDGSADYPWQTIQHAASLVAAGDTVLINPGTYGGGITVDRSGTALQPITFRANGAGVVIEGSGGERDAFYIDGADYVVVEGLTIQHATRAGVRISLSDHVTVRTCVLADNGKWGVFTDFSDHTLIEGNESYGAMDEHGIYISNSSDYPTIRGNRLHHNASCGLHMNGDASMGGDGVISYGLVEKNIVYENGASGGSGINMDGVTDTIIRNNLLYDNHASGISLYQIDGGSGSQNNLVLNNTILMPSDGRWAINIPDASDTGNKVFNNIVYSDHGWRGSILIAAPDLAGFESDYNVVVDRFSADGGNSSIALSAWRVHGYDAHSFVASPSQLFVDPAAHDYTLRADSPAIDTGTALANVSDDLAGKARPAGPAYDIGAYERVVLDRSVCLPVVFRVH